MAAADECASLEVAIQLQSDHSIASRTVMHLKDEAERLWKPYQIRLAWAGPGECVRPDGGVHLEVTLAREVGAPSSPDGARILGVTSVESAGVGGGPIQISLEATRRLLASRSDRPNSFVDDNALARALGRVLAHEIGHRLLGMPAHDKVGLMRPAFRADELGAPGRQRFRLTPGGIGQLTRRLPQLRGDNRSPVIRAACDLE